MYQNITIKLLMVMNYTKYQK